MTVHVNITEDDLSASALVALAQDGHDVVLERDHQPVATLRLVEAPASDDASLARLKAKHPFVGAWEHLGPFSEEFLNSFVGPDPDFDPDKSLIPE